MNLYFTRSQTTVLLGIQCLFTIYPKSVSLFTTVESFLEKINGLNSKNLFSRALLHLVSVQHMSSLKFDYLFSGSNPRRSKCVSSRVKGLLGDPDKMMPHILTEIQCNSPSTKLGTKSYCRTI